MAYEALILKMNNYMTNSIDHEIVVNGNRNLELLIESQFLTV